MIRKHIPLIIPILGSGSAFLLNFIFKSSLPSNEYGEIASLFLITTTLFTIGAIGYEQALVRLLDIKNNVVIFRHSLILMSFLVLIITPFISYAVLNLVGAIENANIFFASISITIPACTLLATLFKVKGDLIPHYMMLNIWKFFLLIVVITTFCLQSITINYATSIASTIALGFFVSIAFAKRSGMQLLPGGPTYNHILGYLCAGFISIIGYSIFDGMDRFTINKLFTSSEFGDYFFIFTFIMSPVSIISAYFTARLLPKYKINMDINNLKADYASVVLISALISSLFSSILLIANHFNIIHFSIDPIHLVIAISLMSVIRGAYSLLSMAYTVVCSSSTLVITGALLGGLSLLAYFFITEFKTTNSILICSYVFIAFWSIRSILYFLLVVLETNRTTNYLQMSDEI